MSFGRYLYSKYGKQLLDGATKTELNALKSVTKKVAHKKAEERGEFIGNRIADKLVKPKPVLDENSKNDKEIIIPPEKREEILKKLRQVS